MDMTCLSLLLAHTHIFTRSHTLRYLRMYEPTEQLFHRHAGVSLATDVATTSGIPTKQAMKIAEESWDAVGKEEVH